MAVGGGRGAVTVGVTGEGGGGASREPLADDLGRSERIETVDPPREDETGRADSAPDHRRRAEQAGPSRAERPEERDDDGEPPPGCPPGCDSVAVSRGETG